MYFLTNKKRDRFLKKKEKKKQVTWLLTFLGSLYITVCLGVKIPLDPPLQFISVSLISKVSGFLLLHSQTQSILRNLFFSFLKFKPLSFIRWVFVKLCLSKKKDA